MAGQLTGERGTLRLNVTLGGITADTISVPLRAGQGADNLTAAAWAQQRIAELDGEYRLNRAEIRRLGMAFNLTSRETALIVLDRVEDYVRHDIVPPAELRAEFDRQRRALHVRAEDERARQLERVAGMFREKIAWWEKDFPKTARPQPEARKQLDPLRRQEADSGALRDERRESRRARLAEQGPAAPPPAPAAARPARSGLDRRRLRLEALDRVNIVSEYDKVVKSPTFEMRLPSLPLGYALSCLPGGLQRSHISIPRPTIGPSLDCRPRNKQPA